MRNRYTISSLDRKIVINTYVKAQDLSGGNIKAELASYEVFASVKQLNGSRNLEQLQIQYQEAYEIIKRYEPSRILNLDSEVEYEDSILSIHAIEEIEEGKKRWNKITAYTTGSAVSESIGVYKVMQQIHYEATGGERSFQDDDLIDWSLIIVFRDGVNYTVVSTTPIGKQAQFDSNEGSIQFDTGIEAMQAREVCDVYLLR